MQSLVLMSCLLAMLDKIWQGTLDTPKIIVLSHEVHFVKSYNHATI